MGKYESPLLDGGFLGAINGSLSNDKTCSSSSVIEWSVGKVGLVIEALEDAGSTDGTLGRIEDSDALDVENVHLGGETGSTGLSSSWLGLGVASVSISWVAITRVFSFPLRDCELERGDFDLTSGPLRSRPSTPFPSRAVFLNDPLLFRVFPCWTSSWAPLGGGLSSWSSILSREVLSELLLLRRNGSLDSMLPDIVRRWLRLG